MSFILGVLEDHLLTLFALVFLGVWIFSKFYRGLLNEVLELVSTKWAWIAACVVILLGLVRLGFYVSTLSFADHAEPTVTSVSWLWNTGHPIYHAQDSAERYSLLYGPLLSIYHGTFLKILGGSLFGAKLPGVLSGFLAMLFCYLIARRFVSWQKSVVLTAIIALVWGKFGATTFWARGDPHLILLVSIATYFQIALKSTRIKNICLGVCAALAVNIKIHSFIYFLPLIFLNGISVWIFVGALPALVLPFFSTGINISNYLEWIKAAGKHGLAIREFTQNFQIAVLGFLPSFLGAQNFRAFLKNNFALLLPVLIICVIACKPGAGFHHLLPFTPLFLFFFLKYADISRLKFHPRLTLTWVLVFFILAITTQTKIIFKFKKGAGDGREKEITEILDRYQGANTNIGYGDSAHYRDSFYAPLAIFRGNPDLVDASALMDMDLSHMPIPENTLQALRDCKIQNWILPKDNEPFSLKSFYTLEPLFSEEFRKIFFQNYEKRETSNHYEIWSCKK
ncbi:MAG: glycosyltransferase family 39 protein [Deltaproteobacteria bacterium]|nr:glycosyltransferase family 39 protein [Deltaproteobacteria bacterium]